MSQLMQRQAEGLQESPEVFFIGDLAEAFGVTARTLRYYEEKGLLQPERHSETQERVFSRVDRDRLSAILAAKRMGFTLREIGHMLEKPDAGRPIELDADAIDVHIRLLERQLLEINDALAQLRSMRAAALDTGRQQLT